MARLMIILSGAYMTRFLFPPDHVPLLSILLIISCATPALTNDAEDALIKQGAFYGWADKFLTTPANGLEDA